MKKTIGILLALAAAGTLAAQNKTDKNGLKQGRWVTYYDNGKMRYEGTFANGKPVGDFKRYYENGKPKLKQRFDAKTGNVYTEFYKENGTIFTKGNYNANEQKIGEWVTFTQKGDTLQTDRYTAGRLDGTTVVYGSGGKVFETIDWKNGRKNGLHKQFFPNGQLQSEINYKNGLRDGLCRTFFDDGNAEVEGRYAADKKEGTWILYDRDGKTVIETVEYHNGETADKAARAEEEQAQIKRDEENAGRLKDPADFKTSPEDYFGE